MNYIEIQLKATDNKDSVVWLAPIPNGETNAYKLSPSGTVKVWLKSKRSLTITMMTKHKNRYELVGTATIVIEMTKAPSREPIVAALVAYPNLKLRTTDLSLAVTSGSAKIVDINPPAKLSSNCYVIEEKTWHEPICIAGGIESLRPVELNDEGIDSLIDRWTNYYKMAKLITDPKELELLFSLTVGFAGGNYHREKGDGRGVAGLTFCESDDCDGMAWDAVSFITQINHCKDRMFARRSFEGQKLLAWGLERYPSAVVTYGECHSPINNKPFMHAWFNLLAIPRDGLKGWGKLKEAQTTALKQAKITEEVWKTGSLLNTREPWTALPEPTKLALRKIGFSAKMWNAKPKLHGDATGVISVNMDGAMDNDKVNKIIADLRKSPTFEKCKLVWVAHVRCCPNQYRSVCEVQGPYYAHKFSSNIKYDLFLKGSGIGPRPGKRCCQQVTVGRYPVFIGRTQANANVAGIESQKSKPKSMPARESILAITNPEGPFGKSTESLVRIDYQMDPYTTWTFHVHDWTDLAAY